MTDRIPLDEAARADLAATGDEGTRAHEVARDVAYQRVGIVNVVFVGMRGARGWVLVDAGIPGSAGLIEKAAAARFGDGNPPAAILATHGHFDHTGALETLAGRWDVPVWAHPLEQPYLDGSAAYPPPDPSVGGGLMSALSRFFPRGPVDVRDRLAALTAGGELPFLPGWRWVHTPGHTPGHVSLWRESDGVLIAADACITTRQESAYAALTQKPEMHGPPAYYTQSWDDARASVRSLAALRPEVLVPGHGRPMRGEAMRSALDRLARDFDEVARPAHGVYVAAPATAEDGTAYRPREGGDPA
jgi:glyoxylase-like metal-dependent hydrolase (beta-lactamase superfamily II)